MKIKALIFLFILGVSLYAYTSFLPFSESEENQGFVELCNIYKEVSRLDSDLPSKEEMLAHQILNKLPSLFENMYSHVMKADAVRRYDLISEYKKHLSGESWVCENARRYYNSSFPKP